MQKKEDRGVGNTMVSGSMPGSIATEEGLEEAIILSLPMITKRLTKFHRLLWKMMYRLDRRSKRVETTLGLVNNTIAEINEMDALLKRLEHDYEALVLPDAAKIARVKKYYAQYTTSALFFLNSIKEVAEDCITENSEDPTAFEREVDGDMKNALPELIEYRESVANSVYWYVVRQIIDNNLVWSKKYNRSCGSDGAYITYKVFESMEYKQLMRIINRIWKAKTK